MRATLTLSYDSVTMDLVNGDTAAWNIDRLARLAAAALAQASPTQPNGRIREVPDVRTIRWYTSIGLLGRPAAMRGRTALYGRSHLAQLVAIKRLQAAGLTVAAVQERLLGAEESAVEKIALLPADLDGLLAQVDATEAPEAPEAPDEAVTAHKPTPTPTHSTASPSPSAKTEARKRFWATPLTPPTATASALGSSTTAEPTTPATAPASQTTIPAPAPATPAPTPTTPSTADAAPPVHGIRLASGVTLLLPSGRAPEAAERAAIAEAARPLLDLLDRLGLSEA